MRIGVLALQGDFAKHLQSIAVVGAVGTEVRKIEDLAACDRLIIPGGESTTLGILIQRHGLAEAISEKVKEGMPIWGTCMGMILLAKRVVGRQQFSLGLLDVEVERNAFGAQVHSFEEDLTITGFKTPFHAVFIRAPAVTSVGSSVEALAVCRDKTVAVRQGHLLATAFHPELTNDARFHEYFASIESK